MNNPQRGGDPSMKDIGICGNNCLFLVIKYKTVML